VGRLFVVVTYQKVVPSAILLAVVLQPDRPFLPRKESEVSFTHVDGRDVGPVMLYALSTCVWCRKTRNLLEELGVAYDYEYVDLLVGPERTEAMNTVRKWNAACSFPTLIVKDKCIVGFMEDQIREALK